MARLQAIVNAVRAQLADVEAAGVGLYDTQAPPNIGEDSFPLVVFNVRSIAPMTYFGEVPHALLGTLFVFHHTLSAAGAGRLREVEQQTYDALHKSRPEAEGYVDVQLRCLLRGGVDFIGEALFGQTDQYEVLGAEE